MAVSGHEILLIFRAKNQASATIRRVAKDVNFLGRTVQANQRGAGTMRMGRRAAGLGAAMTHIGGAATLAGGGALFGLGTAARGFAEFDKLATQAATQIGSINNSTNDVIQNASRLRNAVLSEMQTFPDSAEIMSQAAYDIFSSMDVNFNKGIGLLHLFNQAGVAGMTDVATATDGAITVLNNFGNPNGPIGNSRDLLNDMFSIIRFGRIDLETLNTMMNQIAPAAAAADQSLSDVGGAIATLTRRLGPGIASAGLARLFEIFQRKDFQEGMRKAGVAITDAEGQLLPLQQIIQRIIALGPKPGKTLQNFIQTITAFGAGRGKGVQATVQARRALVTLVKNAEDYFDLQGRMTKNQGQFNKQLRAMEQSLGVRWGVFINNMRRFVLTVGEDAIPVFEDLGNILGPLIDKWMALDSSTKAWIVTTVGSVAMFTLLGGIVTSFAGIVLGIVGTLTTLAGVMMGRVIPALGTFATIITGRVVPAMIAWGSVMTMPGGPGYAFGSFVGTLKSLLPMLARLGAIGTIALGVTLMFQGGEWKSVIGAMLTGAGAGFLLGGPAGAVIGAITVPIILKIIQDNAPDTLKDLSKKELQDYKKTLKERENAVKQHGRAIGNIDLKTLGLGGDTTAEQLANVNKEIRRRADEMNRIKLPAGTIQEQIAAGQFKIPRIGEDVTRGITDNIKKGKDAVKKVMFSNVKTIDQLNDAVDAQLSKGNKSLSEYMDQRADILRQAADEQEQVIQSAVQHLSSTYDQIQQMNESAMGELFQGPFLTSETFNLAQEWGITPAMKDLNRDLREQIQAFNKWQGDLKAIGRKGAPAELVKSLEALGPDAVDKLEVLRKASPKMFNNFIRLWQQRQGAIKRETQIDFKDQLAQWNKYGHDIAFQIIAGLRGENVTLEKGFEKYITTNFAGALEKIKTDALAEFYRENPEARKAEQAEKARQAAVRKRAAERRHEILTQQGDTFHIHQRAGESDAAFAKRIAWERDHRKGRSKKNVKPKITPAQRLAGRPRKGD